jgi:hypothetical protein
MSDGEGASSSILPAFQVKEANVEGDFVWSF